MPIFIVGYYSRFGGISEVRKKSEIPSTKGEDYSQPSDMLACGGGSSHNSSMLHSILEFPTRKVFTIEGIKKEDLQ